jgi:diguanylate cyclase (GGDEF)-like protein
VAISRDVTEHKDLEARLATLAVHDGLTGLANRRCFDETLERKLGRAKRDRTSLCLLMIDVDHFKAFNDLYGRQAGDDCLRKVAEAVRKQACRSGDLAARYGGVEFALLLPDTDAEACEAMAERLQFSLLALGIRHEGKSS